MGDNQWVQVDAGDDMQVYAPNEFETWPDVEDVDLIRYALTLPDPESSTILVGSLDDLAELLRKGLENVEHMRNGVRDLRRQGVVLADYFLEHPALWMLDHHKPGLMWARITDGAVPAEETAVCWQHVEQSPDPHDYGDVSEDAPLVDCTGNGKLSCVVCHESVIDLIGNLNGDGTRLMIQNIQTIASDMPD